MYGWIGEVCDWFEDLDEWEQVENEQQQDQIHYFWIKASLDKGKTKAMNVSNKEIERVDKIKYLGVTLDQRLT